MQYASLSTSLQSISVTFYMGFRTLGREVREHVQVTKHFQQKGQVVNRYGWRTGRLRIDQKLLTLIAYGLGLYRILQEDL